MFKKILFILIFLNFSGAVLAKPVLTVYTNNSFASEWGPGPAVKKVFEKDCACELKFVALSDSAALLNRLRIEGQNSPADIILGFDNNLLQSAEQTGLFAEHGVDTTGLIIPGGWRNTTFIPYDYGYFAFIYNKNTLKNPPKSLHELIESDEPWKVIYQDPRTSTPGLGLLLWIQTVYGDEAPQAWQKLAKKTVTVPKGWSEAYGLFLKGEADLVMSYTSSPAYHIHEENKTNYVTAIFDEGHYMQVEVAGQLKTSKNSALAQKFLQFILTPAFQNVIPTTNWMYPVIKTDLPESFSTLPIPEKALEFNAALIEKHRTDWIKVWQNAVSR